MTTGAGAAPVSGGMAQGRLFGSACRMAISFAARRDPLRPESDPRLRLTGPPASLPLPVTRRCEREPAQQGQPATAQPRDRRRPASAPTHTRSHPPSRPDPDARTPDAHIDARLRSINTAAVLASPDDHGLGRRKQIIIPAPRRGPGASQEGTPRLLIFSTTDAVV